MKTCHVLFGSRLLAVLLTPSVVRNTLFKPQYGLGMTQYKLTSQGFTKR